MVSVMGISIHIINIMTLDIGVPLIIIWRTCDHLCLVMIMFIAQAYCFLGQDLLVQEKCGESVKALQHSSACKLHYFISSISYAILSSISVRSSREDVCPILTHKGSRNNCQT